MDDPTQITSRYLTLKTVSHVHRLSQHPLFGAFSILYRSEKRLYTLHEEAVVRQSKTLADLMEAGYIELPGTDETTFFCFTQFVYSGTYDLAKVVPAVNPSLQSETQVPPESQAKKASESSPYYDTPTDRLWASVKETVDIDKTSGTNHYYAAIFSHVRVFVFANEARIAELENLACHHLRKTLVHVQLDESTVDYIARLVTFVYNNNTYADCARLRDLVAQYSACKMETLWKSSTFQEAFKAHSDFAKDVTEYLVKRLA